MGGFKGGGGAPSLSLIEQRAGRGGGQPPRRSGGFAIGGGFLEQFAQRLHVEVAAAVDPLFMGFDRQGADQPQARRSSVKMRTMWVRRLNSWLRRSSRFVDLRCLWWAAGSR